MLQRWVHLRCRSSTEEPWHGGVCYNCWITDQTSVGWGESRGSGGGWSFPQLHFLMLFASLLADSHKHKDKHKDREHRHKEHKKDKEKDREKSKHSNRWGKTWSPPRLKHLPRQSYRNYSDNTWGQNCYILSVAYVSVGALSIPWVIAFISIHEAEVVFLAVVSQC